jgi:hypothetical protein
MQFVKRHTQYNMQYYLIFVQFVKRYTQYNMQYYLIFVQFVKRHTQYNMQYCLIWSIRPPHILSRVTSRSGRRGASLPFSTCECAC